MSLIQLLYNPRSGEGHGAEAHRVMGARAVPAGGFAACSRAAWASCLPALRPGWEVHPWTGTGEGGERPFRPRPRKPGLKLTLGMKYPSRGEPWGNAVKRARSKRARAASQDAAVVTLRLPAFRFLHLILEVLIGRSSTDERKAGP